MDHYRAESKLEVSSLTDGVWCFHVCACVRCSLWPMPPPPAGPVRPRNSHENFVDFWLGQIGTGVPHLIPQCRRRTRATLSLG